MSEELKKFGKFLAYVLRHRPDQIEIELDEQGWASVDDLVEASRRQGQPLTHEILERVVATDDKDRFAFDQSKTRIRARQGHSVEVDLGLEQSAPPQLLYQGTVAKFLPSIREEGLVRKARHHVHLSEDIETATTVGRRRGKPIILTVRAGEMHAQGFVFYLSGNGVWLTDHVPPGYIVFPP